MPRIPVYQQQVAPQDLPGARLGTRFNVGQFDGGLSGAKAVTDALDQGAKTAYTVGEQIQKKKDAIWVQERLAKLAQKYDTYTYGSPDGQVTGVLTSKGLAAADAAKTAPEFLDQALSELTAEAPSQDALADFRARALSIRTSTSSTIARHAATELNRYHAEAAQGNAQVQMESIAADYNQSPEAIDEAFAARVAPSIAKVARLTGKPTGEVMREARAGLYAQVITQTLATGDTRRAQALMGREDWNDALDAKTRASLTDKIRDEVIVRDSLSIATDLLDRGVGEKAAKQWLDEKYGDDVRMRDAVWTRYRQEQAFRKQGAEESKRAQYGNLLKEIYTTQDPRQRVELAMRANPEFFQGALAFAESLNKPPADSPELKEAAKRDDAVINAELRRMVDAGLIGSETDLYAKAVEFGVREISNVKDAADYWQKGGGGLKDSEVRTMFAEVTGNQAKDKPQIYAAVYSYIEANAPKAEGRQVPPEVVRKLMNQALLSNDGGWFGSEKTLAEHFKTGGSLDDFAVDIPASEREAIVAELKRRRARGENIKVNEENIQRVYKLEFMGFPQATPKPQNVRGH